MSQSRSLEHEASEGKRRRANPEGDAQRKQQKCDIRKVANRSSKPVSYTHTHRQYYTITSFKFKQINGRRKRRRVILK